MSFRENGLKVRAMTDDELSQYLEDNPVVVERGHIPPGWKDNPRGYFCQIIAGMNMAEFSEAEYQERQEQLREWFA